MSACSCTKHTSLKAASHNRICTNTQHVWWICCCRCVCPVSVFFHSLCVMMKTKKNYNQDHNAFSWMVHVYKITICMWNNVILILFPRHISKPACGGGDSAIIIIYCVVCCIDFGGWWLLLPPPLCGSDDKWTRIYLHQVWNMTFIWSGYEHEMNDDRSGTSRSRTHC